MLLDKFVYSREKRRRWSLASPLEKLNEQPDGLLLLGGQGAYLVHKVFGGHGGLPFAVYPVEDWPASDRDLRQTG